MTTSLGKAYVQIIPSAEGISNNISSILDPEAELAGNSAGSKIASGIKKAIAAAGIGQALKSSVLEGAALEQSIGGIETLFKDDAGIIKNYADLAFKTAGLSANDYMQNVTGFAASLLQGLDGDTEKAAEIANMAMIDMSDNANKMGTSIEAIQNAYQGFAKQNYTMLDNLKLGYGGTASEMARLINDSGVLGNSMQVTAETVKDVPFYKLIEAIHVTQDEMGILGTTAIEADKTLAGSFSSMKASAKNVLGKLALGEDIKPALKSLVDTTGVFLKDNLSPAISNIIQTLPAVLIMLIQTAGPQIMEAASGIVSNLSNGFADHIPEFFEMVLPMILSFAEYIRESSGVLVDQGINMILQLIQGLVKALPTLIAYVPEIITNVTGIINDNMPKILAAGVAILAMLIKGIIDSIPALIANTGDIVEAIVSTISAFSWVNLGGQILTNIATGIKNLITTPVTAIKEAAQSIIDSFGSISWSDLGKAIIDGIVNGLKTGASAIVNAAKGVAKDALDSAKSFLGIHSPSTVFKNEVGKMLDLGLAEGIIQNTKPVTDAMDGLTRIASDPIKADVVAATHEKTFSGSFISKSEEAQRDKSNYIERSDIVIPIYFGNRLIDRVVIEANQINDYRSGGR